MRVLVTGGSGYLGSVLIPKLSAAHTVDVLDVKAPISSAVRWINEDVRTVHDEIYEPYDAIVHLAGIVGDAACNKEPSKAVETNYLATKILAKASTPSRKKIVFASTCSVYGASNSVQTEDADPSPISLYGLTKLLSEKIILDANGVVLRFGTLHGNSPRLRFDLVVNEFVRNAMNGRIVVHGGDQMRPFLHILDAADAISASLNGDAGVYNVGSENMTILTLANRIKSKIPCEVEVVTEITDKRSYFVDSTKIMRTFAYVFRKTIEDTVEELKEKIFSKTE